VIITADIGQASVSAFEEADPLFVVDAEQSEHGGVQVVDLDGVFRGAEAEVIRHSCTSLARWPVIANLKNFTSCTIAPGTIRSSSRS